MYLHLGQNVSVAEKEIIGVFDLEITSQSPRTREFLAASERNKRIVNISEELPKSFVVCDKKVYISQLSPATLQKRSGKIF